MHLIARILMILLLSMCPVDAFAQKSDHEQMLALSEEAFEAFSKGDFSHAADTFARAYQLEPDPTLLKNEAIARLKAGEFEAAIDASSRFLIQEKLEPADIAQVRQVWGNAKLGVASAAIESGTFDAAESLLAEVEAAKPDSVLVERIGILRLDLAKRRQEARENATAAETNREKLRLEQAQARARAAELEAQTAAQRQQRGRKTVGVALMSSGAAILIGTAVYHLVALGWEREFYNLAELGGDADRFERLRDRITLARVALPVFYAAGGATAATGVWFFVRSNRSSKDGERELSLALGARWAF
jgi:tetratricopeptide (TPR) repeat protein